MQQRADDQQHDAVAQRGVEQREQVTGHQTADHARCSVQKLHPHHHLQHGQEHSHRKYSVSTAVVL